jgi:flagellar export protein FliJ
VARFRFRAAAALDLRKKEEDAAAAGLAQIEAVLRRITADRDVAETVKREAMAAASLAERAGTEVGAIEWHRNWIVRLRANVTRLHQDLDRQRQAMTAAEHVWREARRKRLALERMRERALRRFDAEETRNEMKALDELARLRYLATAEFGGDES